MADLSDLQAAQSIKVIGSDSTGAEQTPVQSTSNGALHTNLRNNAGTETGTSATPLRTDPTGTTTQPVSDAGGSLTVDGTVDLGATTLAALESITVQNPAGASAVNIQDGGNSITIDATSLPLPTGASTATNQSTANASLASIDAGIPNALGAATIANSMPVNIASDQTVPVSAVSLPLPTGAATSTNQTTEITALQILDDVPAAQNAPFVKGSPIMGQLDDTSTTAATEDNVASVRITAQRSVHTNLRNGSTGAEMIGQKTMATSIPVVFPSDQTLTVTSSPLPASGSGFAFGQISTSATTTIPVEATTYTEQTTNSTMSIASSSALDTSAGTGARSVTITYYDQTMAGPFTTTASLNGITFVNLVAGMCYIEKIVVATVGSTGSNAGTLTLKATTAGGGATIGTVAITQNRTHWAHHYVSTGKICYISGFNNGTNGGSAGQGGLFVLRVSTPTVANTPEIQISDFQNVAGAATNFTRICNSPIQVSGPARIRSYVTPGASSAYTLFSSFDYIDN